MAGEREANVLGALAQALTDRTAAAVTAATGHSSSAAAALTALDQFLERPTLDRLRLVLGLTPSGAVRLVDRLSAAGLVTRGPGDDGRSRSVMLTDRGRAAAAEVAAARSSVLRSLLADLPAGELAVLGRLLDRLMAGVVATKDGGAWICRQCDLAACERAAGRCPAATAAAARYG
ncbi:MarR family winged helix-turn-helix transcriptional regulator [Virgisporangium ochraceum]|uniref:MarR family winged helix-turn-helix transcriptional regulator n=1 Tax=Virgisporangium ochraceum TaxID=65505 RepID=UPI0019453422|nr:MarR family winged helix-turn-helix transcriptional regulator [Virgisporangium ochraceum]